MYLMCIMGLEFVIILYYLALKSIIILSHNMCDNCKKKSILYLRLDSGVFRLKQAIDHKEKVRKRDVF